MASFATHARTIAGDLSDLTRAVLQEVQRQSADFALRAAIAKSPTATGGLKRQWQIVEATASAASDRLKPTKVRNAAPQAVIIDQGRRRSKNAWTATSRKGTKYTVKAGKMLGSEQAPRGIKGPVLRELAAQEDAIFDRARAAAERKVKPR